MRPPLRLFDVYRFFVPLILMAEMTMISHTIVHAILARQPDPKLNLAAFSAGWAFHTALGSPIWATTLLGLSFIRDKQSFQVLLRFALRMLLVLFVVDMLVVFTPLSQLVYGRFMGASPAVVEKARWVTLVLFFNMASVLFKSLFSATLMLNRRTELITLGTGVRLGSLLVLLAVLPYWLSGAVLGAAAHMGCIVVEAIMMGALGWKHYRDLPQAEGPAPSMGDIWRFGWPLMMNHFAENGMNLVINFFLGRLAKPDLSLAAFGVLNGLVRFLLSPLRNLTQTAQALVRERQDRRLVFRFAWQVEAVFVVLLALLFFTPLRWWVLDSVMGLNAELASTVAPGLLLTVLTCVFWGYSALFRGLLAVARTTRPIALASGIRLGVVVLLGVVSLSFPGVNGAVFGAVALAAGFFSDCVVLGRKAIYPAPTA